MAKMFLVSLDVSQIADATKARHHAIKKAKNGKHYAACVMWINDEDDQFQKIGNIRLQTEKDNTTEQKIYVGNVTDPDSLKRKEQKDTGTWKGKGSKPATKKDAPDHLGAPDDMPF